MPKFFIFAFADDGDKTAIPDDTQISGSVSYEEGYGFDYQRDLATDPLAKAFPRAQNNQLMFDITDNIQQYQTHGVPNFITTSDNDGSPYPYDIYARVRYDDGSGFKIYENQVNGNTTLPTDNSWIVLSGNESGLPIGTIIDFAGPVVPVNFLICDGAAYSRSTYASLLASLVQSITCTTTNGSNVITGISNTSSMYVGAPVEGLPLPAGTVITNINSISSVSLNNNANDTGSNLLVFYNYGNGNGSTTFNVPDCRRKTTVGAFGTPSSVLGSKPGESGGEESTALVEANNGPHSHAAPSGDFLVNTGNAIQGGTSFGSLQANTASSGSGTPHNTMQPSLVVTKCIKYR